MPYASTVSDAAVTDLYTLCVERLAGGGSSSSSSDLLECIADQMSLQHDEEMIAIQQNARVTRDGLLLLATSLVFFMQAGFAMVCAGSVRRKNLQNTMLKNILDTCGATLAFWSVGYAFAFGDGSSPNAFIGTTSFFLHNVDNLAVWVFQYTFSAASATIVAGALAERCQMSAYFYYSILLTGFVYPVIVHAIWSPYGMFSATHDDPLFGVGVLDFAGGGVVHMTGGFTAFIAAWVLGPRRGRFHDAETGERLEQPKELPGHSVGLQMLGTLVLWFGWFGFNGGSALLFESDYHDVLAGLAVTNTTLAGGTAGVTTLFINLLVTVKTSGEGKYDLVKTMNGTLGGLVAITAGCGFVEPFAAVIIGFFAGLFYLLGNRALVQWRIDDAVDAVPVHLFCGMWGVIAVGLFTSPLRQEQAFGIVSHHPGFFYTIFGWDSNPGGHLLAAQVVGLVGILLWTAATMGPFFMFLEWRGIFRSDAMDEIQGLDKSFHGGVNGGAGLGEGGGVLLTKDQLSTLQKRVEKSLKQYDPNASEV